MGCEGQRSREVTGTLTDGCPQALSGPQRGRGPAGVIPTAEKAQARLRGLGAASAPCASIRKLS